MPSIFDGLPGEDEGVVKDNILDLARQVNVIQLATYLGCTWDKTRKFILCPNPHNGHMERDPSLHVYPDHAYCFSCGTYFGPVDLVMAFVGLDFGEALDWYREHIESVAHVAPTIHVVRKSEYKGIVPREMVEYWCQCLTPEHRQWLHARLIKDKTIDTLRIGWRPDYKAYTIPFWRGGPGNSDIDIVQYRFRYAKDGEKRWSGLTGYNRPSVINSHMIGKHSVVILFGTFDAVLAAQDGIAALSTNGATTFTRDADNIERLNRLVKGCRVFVVPDKNETEARAAYLLAHHLHAEVRHFPKDMSGKDYTDFRLAGGTPGQFLREVLMLGDGFIKPEHDELFTDLLDTMSNDMWDSTETILFALQSIYPQAAIVNQHIQLRMQFDPFPGITHDQWDELREMIPSCIDWSGLFMWGQRGCEMAHANRGGF